MTSTSLTKVHVIKLPRNKVSAFDETNNNSHCFNRNPSTDIKRKVLVKTISVRSKQSFRTNTKHDIPMRRRASSFDEVIVNRITKTHAVDKSFINRSMNNIQSNNRVTVIPLKKQQSSP